MNKVSINGRFVKDIDLRTSAGGKKYTFFTLAVRRTYSKEKASDFIDCQAWGGTAEKLAEFFGKGDPVILHGSIGTYAKEIDGKKLSFLKVLVNEFEFDGKTKKFQQVPQPAGAWDAPVPAQDIPFDDVPLAAADLF